MVDTFEMAEKLAKMDGTDDGMYNDLPIEVCPAGVNLNLLGKLFRTKNFRERCLDASFGSPALPQ